MVKYIVVVQTNHNDDVIEFNTLLEAVLFHNKNIGSYVYIKVRLI